MKYLIIALSMVFSAPIIAQTGGYDVDKAVEKLAKLYNLTDAQQAQFKPVLEKKLKVYKDVMSKQTKGATTTIDQKEILEADNAYQKGVMAILDENQKEAFINHQRVSKGLLKKDEAIMSQEELKTLSGAKPKQANQ